MSHRHRWILTARPDSATPFAISPTQEAIIRDFAGPFITSAQMPGGLSWWDSYYNTEWDRLWDYPSGTLDPGGGAKWNAGNSTAYYEQGEREFVNWIRFGLRRFGQFLMRFGVAVGAAVAIAMLVHLA
jgi:hypothetical protein